MELGEGHSQTHPPNKQTLCLLHRKGTGGLLLRHEMTSKQAQGPGNSCVRVILRDVPCGIFAFLFLHAINLHT